MKILNKKISDLKEYKNNPRINDDAVEYVKKSIEEFGYKVPRVIIRIQPYMHEYLDEILDNLKKLKEAGAISY